MGQISAFRHHLRDSSLSSVTRVRQHKSKKLLSPTYVFLWSSEGQTIKSENPHRRNPKQIKVKILVHAFYATEFPPIIIPSISTKIFMQIYCLLY